MKNERQFKKMELLIIGATLLFAIAGVSFGKGANEQRFDLKVATVLDAPKTTLAFTIKNNGETTLEMAYPGVGDSPIIIVTPSGKVMEYALQKDWLRLPTQLKPSESKTWNIDYIADLFRSYKLEEIGLYKISWNFFNYKSNEILLFKE